MEGLDLLKSLTQGVNKKIKQDELDIEYIVDMSLSNKNKKSANPIIQEKKSFFNDDVQDLEEDYIEDTPQGFDDDNDVDYIEDTNQIIDEDSYIQEDYVDDVIVETPYMDDEYVEEVASETEYMSAECVQDSLNDASFSDNLPLDLNKEENKIDDKKDSVEKNGHISEDLIKENKKIQRNGNPFKRGPRKKKVQKDEEVLKIEDNKPSNLEMEDAPISSSVLSEVISEVDTDSEFNIDDDMLNSLFSNMSDEDDLDTFDDSEKVESLDNSFLEDEDTEDTEDVDVECDDQIENDEDRISKIKAEMEAEFREKMKAEMEAELREKMRAEIEELKSQMSSMAQKNKELETVLSQDSSVNSPSEPEFELELMSELETDEISQSDSVVDEDVKLEESAVSLDTKDSEPEEPSESSVKDEDEKFKNCVYYKGMSVEDFLRENLNYREALYVEHFFSKDELNKLLMSGCILLKKGKYRL